MNKAEQQYIDLYRQYSGIIKNGSSSVMNAPRDAAFETFSRKGFPTRKVEEYKYTDIPAIFEPDYGLNINRVEIPVNPYEVFRCDVPNLGTSLHFVVNDSFYTAAEGAGSLPEGVIFGSLKKVSEEYPAFVEQYYSRLAPEDDALVAFNTMMAQDGVILYVPDGCVVDKTIQIVNILRSDVDLMANRRMLIIMGANSKADILVCDHASDRNTKFLSTQVTEVYVGEGATLNYYEFEETHLGTSRVAGLWIDQAADSHVVADNITLHNGITRNTTRVYLSGSGASADVSGLAIADSNEHVDNNTLIEHRVSDCRSDELFKYVLDDHAVGAFAGLILVKEGAQRTVSQETNRNLLATTDARMYTQPMLEIYADDVKCSHGSTVGQLDENALFYMRQRGIPLREARLLLMFAFVSDVVDKITLEPLRDRLHVLVEKRFRGELGRCSHGCASCKGKKQ